MERLQKLYKHMINILDNNALIELEKSGSYVAKYNSCFITEEIKQEFAILHSLFWVRCANQFPVQL